MARNDQPKGNAHQERRPAVAGQSGGQRRTPEDEIRQATLPEGGVGGRSGTGQARVHHCFDDPVEQQARGLPVDSDAILPEPATGPGYQSGGSGLDLEQVVRDRKQRDSGMGASRGRGPGRAPPPGAPVKSGR